MKAVILVGGKGTRLNKITKQIIPKPMVKIGSLPVLEHQIRLLKKYGFKDIILLTGYLSSPIKNHFQDGKKLGVNINYFEEDKPLGTAGAVKGIEKQLTNDFVVLYGDVMLDLDLRRLVQFHQDKKSCCTLVVHPNDHMHDSDLVEMNQDCYVTAFHSKPHPLRKYFQNLSNACAYVMSPSILKYIKKNQETDFAQDVFPKLLGQKIMTGYNTPEYIKDMGTLDRLKQVSQDYFRGKIKKLNLKNKRRAIFLDRDGVINYDPDNLSKIKNFKLLPKTTKAVKLLNSSDYLTIVVTNQPMIAKGFMSFETLAQIHKKMETLLGRKGAKLDGIYFCPHHPDKGFPGEVPGLKIECSCRKPKPGLILKAVKDFNIDLANSWIVGDSETDIEAGLNAGIKTLLVGKNQKSFQQCKHKTQKTRDLYSAVNLILKNDNNQNTV